MDWLQLWMLSELLDDEDENVVHIKIASHRNSWFERKSFWYPKAGHYGEKVYFMVHNPTQAVKSLYQYDKNVYNTNIGTFLWGSFKELQSFQKALTEKNIKYTVSDLDEEIVYCF